MYESVYLYDTTLRDGNQARGISFSLADKLLLTQKMDEFGIDYIEGGWPNATNPLDTEYFAKVKHLKLKNSKIAAFGSTRRPNIKAADDKILQALVQSETSTYTIFGKSWDIHVTDVIRTSLDENLAMIRESVEFLKKSADRVFYDAEHFFDGYKANPQYAIDTLRAAQEGGADCIVLCDTNGGMALSWELEEIIRKVKVEINCELGIHCHNDTETAVINSLASVRMGVAQVQGTINGFGERCGNANLTTIIGNLITKMNVPLKCADQLGQLRKLSLAVDQVANLTHNTRAPYVGDSAFAHKGGAHIDGVMKVRHSFEHIDPDEVGNHRDFIISDQAGGALIVGRLEKLMPSLDKKDPRVGDILRLVKEKEKMGYLYDTAGGSFELLAMRHLAQFSDVLDVQRYRVIEELKEDGLQISEASVKVVIAEKTFHRVAEGDGPVNALDQALRLCLKETFAYMDDVRLQNFNVKVLDTKVGSAAQVRVWANFSDGENSWQTAGVSGNIIEASFEALLDGFNYKIMKENS